MKWLSERLALWWRESGIGLMICRVELPRRLMIKPNLCYVRLTGSHMFIKMYGKRQQNVSIQNQTEKPFYEIKRKNPFTKSKGKILLQNKTKIRLWLFWLLENQHCWNLIVGKSNQNQILIVFFDLFRAQAEKSLINCGLWAQSRKRVYMSTMVEQPRRRYIYINHGRATTKERFINDGGKITTKININDGKATTTKNIG